MPKASRFGCPHLAAASGANKTDQKNNRSEATLFFPFYWLLKRGPSEGGRQLRSPSLLTFLGETRKVSGCRAAPGASFRPEKDKN
jgi:hypothetical protein